jgi:type II secretory pathway predicted ATPase ExeA
MTAPTNPPELATSLKALWGASQVPFGDAVAQPFASATFTEVTRHLEQLVAVRACGLVHGRNGIGKSLLVEHFLQSLPEKRFKSVLISHSSVTGSDLLRLLCRELGRTPRMRRADNLNEIRQAWQQLERLWPILVLDEAQNLSATALEEVRLLSCDRRDTQSPFSLLLVGDTQLLPHLQMGVNAPLLARLGFCFHLQPWTLTDAQAYFQARLEEAGIHNNPFEDAAVQLLIQAANGVPRHLNRLAQRSIEAAVAQGSRLVTIAHLHHALKLMPWIAKL